GSSIVSPSTECLSVNRSTTWPVTSMTHTAWTWAAQSRPAKNCAGGSVRDNSTPRGGSDSGPAATRPAPGRSLTGALWRISLLPVRSLARTGGGGVIQAVERRPDQTVTPAPAESLHQAP